MSDRSQVLPFTLTELLALLFFALALALAFQWLKREEAEERIRSSGGLVEAAEELPPEARAGLAAVLLEARDSFPEDFTDLQRGLQSMGRERLIAQAALRESGVDTVFLDTASTSALIDSLAARLEAAEILAGRLASEAGFSAADMDPMEALAAELAATRDSLQQCVAGVQDMRNQLANCQRRLGPGGGGDHLPCWANEFGRVEFIYKTTLRTNTIDVEPAWPPNRTDEVSRIPGAMNLLGDDLSYATFAARAIPVFRWSQAQSPECRLFVQIFDDVDGGKEAFKDALLTVERFFYKLLMN